MAKISVYFAEYNDGLAPMMYCVYFGRAMIDWDKTQIFIPINAPFKRKYSEDFSDDILSLTITQGELILHPDRPSSFGIHLPTVLKRINRMRAESIPFTLEDIEQFIIQVGDIEDIFQLGPNEQYAWRK